jgi:copper homeostasis protein
VNVLVEAAVETVAGAIAAVHDGAGRLEVCSDLPRGGTTPSVGLLRAIRTRVDVPLHVLIRPRPGDFQYSVAELEAMLWDIAEAKRTGADGVVIGVLTQGNQIDRESVRRLITAARPMAVTFHRAVDATPEVGVAIDTLVSLGIERVLTSGGAATVDQGLRTLATLAREFGQQIGIMPGGQVRARNVARIVQAVRATEVHVGYPGDSDPSRIAEVCAALAG